MPNTFVNVLSDNRTLELPVPASLAIGIGDLCYWDSANKLAKPITSLTTGASEAVDQEQVAQNFVGIALDARLSTETDTTATRLFLADGICDMTLYNDTFNLSDLIAATWNGGAALVTQAVRRTTSLRLALGRVIKLPASGATKVRAHVQSRVAWDLANSVPALGVGVINSQFSIAGVGNGADTTDDTLFSYTLPANALGASSGRALRIKAFGKRAAGGGNNVVKIFFGATAVAISAATATAADTWEAEAVVWRSGANTQLGWGRTVVAAVVAENNATPAETETGAITIKVTGSDAGSNANKVLGQGFVVEMLQW